MSVNIDDIVNKLKDTTEKAGVDHEVKTQNQNNITQTKENEVPVSFCVIYDKKDEKFLDSCLEQMPNGSEICLLETIPSNVEEATIEITNKYDPQKNIRYNLGTWKYQEFIGIGNRSGFSFSKAKNHCMSMANRKWIWIVDSDERINWVTKDMNTFIKNASEDCGGFWVTVMSPHYPKPGKKTGDIAADPQVRIVLNHKNIKHSKRCHEQISDSIKKAGFKVYFTPIQTQHIGYYGISLDMMLFKFDRNVDLLIQEIYENPADHYSLRMLHSHLSNMIENGWLPSAQYNKHKIQGI